MKKYIQFFKNYFSSSLEYRANLVGTIITETLGIISLFILWSSIFKDNSEVNGYTLEKLALYYVLIPLVGTITQAYISDSLSKQIKYGEFSTYLIKPYKIWLSSFVSAIASKIYYLLFTLPIYAIVFAILYANGLNLNFNFSDILLSIFLSISAFILHFFLDLSITWLSFWFTDIWSFSHLKHILFEILGGVSLPFELLPAALKNIFSKLPFKFFYYVPLAFLMNSNLTLKNFLTEFFQISLWAILFACSSIILFKLGVRKYEAYGN
jgi:ABC-2 type transport system permease protein